MLTGFQKSWEIYVYKMSKYMRTKLTVIYIHYFVNTRFYIISEIMFLKYIFRYVSILVELTRMEGTRHGRLIASQMLDVAIRVQAIRSFAVAQMVR